MAMPLFAPERKRTSCVIQIPHQAIVNPAPDPPHDETMLQITGHSVLADM